jgi:pentapeptide MXKDX repeat protein
MQVHAPAAAQRAGRDQCTRAIPNFFEGIPMKKLISMVFAGCMAVSMSGAFAADSMKKDEMKKDSMAKDGMMKKDEMKKDSMAKDGMMKKDEMKK